MRKLCNITSLSHSVISAENISKLSVSWKRISLSLSPHIFKHIDDWVYAYIHLNTYKCRGNTETNTLLSIPGFFHGKQRCYSKAKKVVTRLLWTFQASDRSKNIYRLKGRTWEVLMWNSIHMTFMSYIPLHRNNSFVCPYTY